MTFKSITYDYNSATAQQITVPLNSRYGVAVKVYNDGVEQSVDISVDGVATEDGTNGWKTAELSSGNVEGITSHAVRVDGYPVNFPLLVVEKDMGYFEI
jgi:hypothetical protein